MENISDILGSVLSDPESMAKLRETARQLGMDASEESDGGLPGGETPAAKPQSPPQQTGTDGFSGLVPALNKLAPLLGKLNEEDDMTRLIHALKPYLSGARLKRAEEADRIVSIMRVIPLLRQSQDNK